MQGWQLNRTNEPLELVTKPDPEPGPGEVLIGVKAAGLCHTDVGMLHDPGWMSKISAPVILGHECAGVVQKIGPEVSGFQVGDRVGVAPLDAKTGKTIGAQRDGAYSDVCLVGVDQLIHLPDNVSFEQGAAATDAGMSSYHPLFKVGGATKGMKVGIIGVGGLGQFAANMALIAGCDVSVADTSAQAREWARGIGIEKVYEQITDMAQDDVELIVDFAGFGSTTRDAISAVRSGGLVILVGMGKLEATIDTGDLIVRNITLRGNNGGTAQDIADVYGYFQTGKMHPTLTATSFDKIPEGLDRLEQGAVSGRLIAVRD
ncbi:zinc-dependent alcohol dehydrogenase [Bombiscardovia nodaiensis]|uniref:alcohol dehydrogenase n=1 Tax=Bombiscardovia nodaiensis TaxID=2932181 RepID=A0ABN6S8P5_9BIFI|nr:zinc-dependent alcohol dehydrogenase [Bombiscardovia nodaiensis]